MTAYRFVTLTCDRCGEIFDEGTVTKIPATRKYAKERDWSSRGVLDYCPTCTKFRREAVSARG